MPTRHALLCYTAAALLAAAASFAARPAHACSVAAPGPFFELTEPAQMWIGVPLEGVLVFHGTQRGDPTYASDAGEPAEGIEIVVRDAEGAEVSGTAETVRLRSDINAVGYAGMSSEQRQVLVVWRADESLAPSSDYTAEVDAFAWRPAPSAALPRAPRTTPAATALRAVTSLPPRAAPSSTPSATDARLDLGRLPSRTGSAV